ncbi:hypothetical protein VN12_20845 [Pirellula sp. SH-Sr6A]|uniref:hypothetical protein n=1 Tax=Pirellula sp. SH-Sr6A TaxID=1632865 RepID=UPI00078B8E43|nr:hypothetical protein [Pirellula sp. SH-Sr6A]AMV34585.1 hypothetical protein VN12_20845 [Pirellula sp. SH-Sr6A]
MATLLKGVQKGKGGSIRKSGSNMVYTERHRYIVLSDVRNESILNVLSTAGLPKVMVSTIAGTGGNCVCVGLDPKQDEGSPFTWFVDSEWSTESENQTTSSNPDPTTWVPRYSGKVETYPEVIYKDFSTPPKPYLNSAKDKFPEPLIVRRPVIVYDFFQYEAPTVTDVQIGDRNDTINSAIFKGFGAQTLKLTVTGFERGFYFGFDCVRINYSVAYKKNKWLNTPLDMGYSYLTSTGERIATDKIVCLNSDGTKKSDNATPDTLEFKEFPEISFSFLR